MKFRTFLLALIVATFFIGVSTPKADAADGQTVYGSVTTQFVYTSLDSDTTGGDADADTAVSLNGAISRVGVKGTKGNTAYTVELGVKEGSGDQSVYLRQAFAEVTVGTIKLLAGQTYSPSFSLGSAPYGITVFGNQIASVYEGRSPMIKVSTMGAYLALLPTTYYTVTAMGGTASDLDITIPKLVVGYNGKAGPASFGLGFGYNSYKIDDGSGTGIDGESITSYAAFVRLKYAAGPITAKVNFAYTQNPQDYGIDGKVTSGSNGLFVVTATDEVVNTTGMGAWVSVMYNFGMGAIDIGFSWNQTANDEWTEDADASMQYYVQIPIGLDKNFKVIPGVYFDAKGDDEAGLAEGTTSYYGIAFQGNF